MFNWRLSLREPYTFWAGLIGGAFLTVGTHGTDHSLVKRYLSAKSQADASRHSGERLYRVPTFANVPVIGIELACIYSQASAART